MSVDANTLAHLAKLVESALDDVDNAAVRGSVVLRKAVRVARLREDWEDVWWLRLQSINPKEQKTEYDELRAELTRYLPADDWDATSGRVFNKWLALREREDGNVQAMPLHDLEAHVDGLAAAVNRLEDPPFDLTTGVVEFRKVEARIREAIATYLADVERQLLSGRLHSTAFERSRRHVEERLAVVAPAALERLRAADNRRAEGDPEALTHALTSCRRVLVSLADALYPATGEVVLGSDRKERKMTEDKFLNRLSQFVIERSTRSASRDLILGQVESLGDRLSNLNSLGSKGVHATASGDEVDLTIAHTYSAVGDLLRLHDATIA